MTQNQTQGASSARFAPIDRLRVFLTVLVILHHVGQAYGPTGGYWPIMETDRAPILGTFFGINAAFFMGFFFFLAGYFEPASLDRKGSEFFLGDRLVRLGIPLFITGGLVMPVLVRRIKYPTLAWGQFLRGDYLHNLNAAHMWFVGQLLVFAIAYAVLRSVVKTTRSATPRPPRHGQLALYALALGLVTAVVRTWWPIDRWVEIPFLRFEPYHWPQYASLFMIGHYAGRGRWLQTFDRKVGYVWLGIAAAIAAEMVAYRFGGLECLRHDFPQTDRSIMGELWPFQEAILCVGLCAGCWVVSRDLGSGPTWFSRWAPSTYAVYFIHLYLVLAVQAAFRNITLAPLAKFALVGLISVPLCFVVGAGIRRLPLARRVF